jgi:hypothetical protein
MRIFNFIFGALLFAAAIYLSYWHTYDLLERGSYLSNSAHVGTFLGEGIFALGTINIFYSKIKHIEVRWFSAPRIALYAGVGIVGYSNISSGFGKGGEAIGIGVAIPILMLIAEAVVSHSLMEGQPQIILTPTFEEEKETQEILKKDSQPQIALSKDEAISKISHTTLTPVFETSQQNSKSNEVSQKFEMPHNLSNESSNKFEDSHSKTNEVLKPQTSNHKPSHKSEGNIHTTQIKNEEAQISTNEFEGSPEEFARDYLDRNGKLPTIKLIKEKTGATDWTARQARSNLKKSIEKAS